MNTNILATYKAKAQEMISDFKDEINNNAAISSLRHQIKYGDNEIAGTEFLSDKPTEQERKIMDSWEDPRGPEFSKKAIAKRKAMEANRAPWHVCKTNVLTLCAFAFSVGLVFGLFLL